MSYNECRLLGVLAVLMGLSGCRVNVGANHLFLVTRMNSGFDVDTMPPVVELSLFSRFDGVRVPSFEDAKTVPTVVSFRRGGRGFLDGWLYSGALFAAGAPALAIASLGATSREPSEDQLAAMVRLYEGLSEIELRKPPTFDNANKSLFGPGEAPPMWFASGESIGIEFEFFGPTIPLLPQSVHAGFRRKEYVVVPLALANEAERDRPYVVRTPSILAIINAIPCRDEADGGSNGSKNTDGLRRRPPRRIQLFATGQAAVRIATQTAVRELFLEGLVE